MNKYVGEIIQQFETNNIESREIFDSLTEAQFNWTPGPGAWSIGQCFDHLIVMHSRFYERLRETVAQAKQDGLTGEFTLQMGLFGKFMYKQMAPPVTTKFNVPEGAAPHETMIPLSIREDFISLHDRIADEIKNAQSVNWNRVKMTSPFIRWIRLRLSAWVYIIPAHVQRHIIQARNVRKHVSFPA